MEIFRWLQLSRINFRTHRKLLVVDGRIGFIGGVGISDAWDGDADDAAPLARHALPACEGPVVAQMQQRASWKTGCRRAPACLHGDDYFPELPPAGDKLCQVFKSSASEGADSARVMFLLSLAAARRSIRIANAYFIPDRPHHPTRSSKRAGAAWRWRSSRPASTSTSAWCASWAAAAGSRC